MIIVYGYQKYLKVGKTIGTNGNNNSEDYVDVINVVKHLAEQANKWFGLGY